MLRTLGPFPPDDVVTIDEVARILGCTVKAALVLLAATPLVAGRRYAAEVMSRADVESLATEVYGWRSHQGEDDSYWVTGAHAATALGVSSARLNQLADRRAVLFKVHQDGTRLYRRTQLDVLGKARASRKTLRPPT